jgi:hypothetical protein
MSELLSAFKQLSSEHRNIVTLAEGMGLISNLIHL